MITGMGTLRTRSARIAVTATSVAAITAMSLSGSVAIAAPAAARLPCRATMSNAHPADYTTTDVRVHTAARAHVTTVAHYKTTVSVSVAKGNRTGSCSTSFTPHR